VDTNKVKLTYFQTVIAVVALAVTALGVGFSIGQHVSLPSPTGGSTDLAGRYEWQWAGENWFGKITLSNHNTISRAKVGVLKKVYMADGSAKFDIQDDVMKLVEGTYQYDGDSKVEIDMLVKKHIPGESADLEQRIVGTLEKRRCFAGQVEYQDHLTGKRYLGDIILVDYCSHLGDDVLAWSQGTK
jgi:hypothetical protein